MQRVVLFGECMLELQGEAFGSMQQSFGGDTLNTAVYLARCATGLQVGYATALGDDKLSAGMLARWQAEALDVSLVQRLSGRMPGLYLIEVDAHGERSFSYWRDNSAAKSYFDAEQTPLEAAADSLGALYLSGISLAILPAAGRERLFALMARLQARGTPVIFDNNYRPRLWASREEALASFDRAYSLASIALVTADDEQALRGLPQLDDAVAAAKALPCPEVVIKRGRNPTLVRTASGLQEVATELVAKVVDTTAAGDSFAAGYLAVRLQGGDVVAAATQGNRLAGRVIQHRGALIPMDVMTDLVLSNK